MFKKYLGCFFIGAMLVSTQSYAEGAAWTQWLDRDNPSGTGDWEGIVDFPSGSVCDSPYVVQARVIGTDEILNIDDEMPDVMYRFDIDYGLSCRNQDQGFDESCSDYEVRFLCDEDYTPTFSWTNWLDRDNISGTGDWENLSAFSASQVCDAPVFIQARVVGYIETYNMGDETPDLLAQFNASYGLACKNADQEDGKCSDYEVRFLCED